MTRLERLTMNYRGYAIEVLIILDTGTHYICESYHTGNLYKVDKQTKRGEEYHEQ